MRWFTLAVGLTPLAFAGFLGLLLRKLRRRGIPDRAGELVTAAGAAFAAGNLAANLTLDHPPGWLPYAILAPWTLLSFGFAGHRLRRALPQLTAPPALDVPARPRTDE